MVLPHRRAYNVNMASTLQIVGLRTLLLVGDLHPVFAWRRPAVLATLLALTGALVLALPVLAVYRWTTPRDRYDPALAESIFILPTTVAGIVTVVQGSLAIAFSLAGVVTTVRFRSALKDTNDASYIFAAVAIGVAAGAEALDIATVLSLVFSAAMALIWTVRPSVFEVTARAPETAPSLSTPHHKGQDRTSQDGAKDSNNARHTHLTVHAPTADVGRSVVEPLLSGLAKSWTLDRTDADANGVVLTYSADLRKHTDPKVFCTAIMAAGGARGVVASLSSGPDV